ncbi:hypothetical protein H8356DRAFT_1712379 [Neocallimastix lanati (nom. inval.)]|jgi:hypothetical protein|uniref:Uncharacterized protein n=1 Tax=Neocallimastix californiae TaxID=1754190 RepID=A0A1Y2AEZ3_9FUNG|nr:hypothetical protein H8356DRAFT_1712379 [Neocallimastix sp. JGI-2020a]ORY20525.1 hypothetical protein LY90DRAFT_707824 [Neocallimastix californiae]|eukprot:ORY20525.1 hypothetical protein LY90DRAFT_707824 [Neocallimastix californiae]
MNRNKLFTTAFNGLRSKYQTLNTKTTSSTVNNYSTVANENGNRFTINYLNNYSPYYPKMVQNAYNSFEGHQQRFVSTGGRGMFAQKEAAMEEQWVYNKDRELLKIIKKKLAAKDAMTFANQNQPTIPLNIAKSMNFNPAFNTKGIRFQVRQSPLRLSEKAELLKNSSQTFYNNPVLNARKLKLSADMQSSRASAAPHQPQNQERLERLKEKFFTARKP